MRVDEDQALQEQLDQEAMDATKAPIMDHLRELRSCIKWSLYSLIIFFIIGLILFDPLFQLLTAPLYEALSGANLNTTVKYRTMPGAFFFQVRLGLLFSILTSTPVIFYQIWRFVAPGLKHNEKRLAVPFAIATSTFFALGVCFCYTFVLPMAFNFFLSYAQDLQGKVLEPDIDLEGYLDTVNKLILAFGIVFQTPIFLGFLSWIELITYKTLIKYWRWATLSTFILAAMLTPPDYVTQVMLAIPLLGFYGLSILISYQIYQIHERRRAKRS